MKPDASAHRRPLLLAGVVVLVVRISRRSMLGPDGVVTEVSASRTRMRSLP
jgi:hypothetical protein